MSETKPKMDWVNSLPKMTFMEDDAIRDAFIQTNIKTRGSRPDQAETFYEKESMYLKRVIFNSIDPNKPKQDLRNCSTFSLYACFMDMAINGDVLSFNPDDKLTYVTQRGYKSGRDNQGKDIWEQRAKMIISPYGELAIRMDYGQIKYADPAVVVRDGDAWDLETDERSNVVSRWKSKLIGRPTNTIIGSFIKITRVDGSFITAYLLQEDISRLQAYSSRQNGGYANALYGNAEGNTGIDPGFLKAKTLKHAFATFPKVKLRGTNSDLDDQQEEMPDEFQRPAQVSQLSGNTPWGPEGPNHQEYNNEDFTPGQIAKGGVKIDQEEETF